MIFALPRQVSVDCLHHASHCRFQAIRLLFSTRIDCPGSRLPTRQCEVACLRPIFEGNCINTISGAPNISSQECSPCIQRNESDSRSHHRHANNGGTCVAPLPWNGSIDDAMSCEGIVEGRRTSHTHAVSIIHRHETM